MSSFEAELNGLRERGLFRKLAISERLDFSSNDYLGLSRHAEIRRQLIDALQSGISMGATGSRLLGGNSATHERVEGYLAKTFAAESALLFSSGFLANLAVMSLFDNEETAFFSDQLNHASLIDGIRATRSERLVFRHNDINHLEDLLKPIRQARKVIVTESVFSMDGDLAPIGDLRELADRHDAWLVVDEAHATGVFGLGRMIEHTDKTISIHTGGKALGGQGAFVVSSNLVREMIINRARPFIFTTALTPLSALQLEFAVRAIVSEPNLGPDLLAQAGRFRKRLEELCGRNASQSQIIPVLLGSSKRAVRAAEHLQARGFDVRAIRAPTVAAGSERLRLSLKSFHTEGQLEDLLSGLREAVLL